MTDLSDYATDPSRKDNPDLSDVLKKTLNAEHGKEAVGSVPDWREDNIKAEPDWESDYVSEYPSEINSHYGKKDAGYYLSAAYRFGYLLIVLSLVIVGIAKGSLADEVAALAFILASRMWDM